MKNIYEIEFFLYVCSIVGSSRWSWDGLQKFTSLISSEKSQLFLEPFLSELVDLSYFEHFCRLNLVDEVFHGTSVHHL